MVDISVKDVVKSFDLEKKILDGLTFQVDSGDRMEFSVTGQDYGMLIEGDRGTLSFQGTRYQGFERI